jgi:fatty acid desaturase
MRLRYTADVRTLGFVAAYYALVLFQWVVVPRALGVAFPLLAMTCVMSFLCAVITHNTVHMPVFRGRFVNRVFQVVLSLSYGSAVSAFVPGHNLSHHRYTQTPRDVMRTTKVRHAWNLLNLFEFVLRCGISIAKNDVAYARAMKERHPSWFRQYRIENVVVVGSTIALITFDWKKGLVYWLVPHLYAAWGIISEEGPRLLARASPLRSVGHHQHELLAARRLRSGPPVQPFAQFRRQVRELVDVQQRLPRHPPRSPDAPLEPFARGARAGDRAVHRGRARPTVAVSLQRADVRVARTPAHLR